MYLIINHSQNISFQVTIPYLLGEQVKREETNLSDLQLYPKLPLKYGDLLELRHVQTMREFKSHDTLDIILPPKDGDLVMFDIGYKVGRLTHKTKEGGLVYDIMSTPTDTYEYKDGMYMPLIKHMRLVHANSKFYHL